MSEVTSIPPHTIGDDRFAIWDVLTAEKSTHEMEIEQLKSRIGELERRNTYLDTLRVQLVKHPCPTCHGKGEERHYDELDSIVIRKCLRCHGTREAVPYDWEKKS